MPERATGGNAVADELFDLFEFRKAALLLPRADDLVINAHLKDATGPIRGERHGMIHTPPSVASVAAQSRGIPPLFKADSVNITHYKAADEL
jgi:hypothetical protein